jgi:hypothetical protein
MAGSWGAFETGTEKQRVAGDNVRACTPPLCQ